jgi:GNAT superfamily N-acetyltransferase
MAINYRGAVETDIPEAAELFLVSLADMYERAGIKAPPPERSMILMNYGHIFRTGIFYVAEADKALCAICHAIVRDSIWFLSGFWALPGFQGQGIGGRLLKIVMEEGTGLGAQTFFTWSSIDRAAMATYMKMGLLPGYQILTFTGQPLESMREGVASVEVARATRRETDHRFWLGSAACQGKQLMRDGHAVGYFYVNKGTIGPAAWLEAEDAEVLLDRAVLEAMKESTDVRLMIPGINHAAIRFALACGLRLSAYAHLLTTATFGKLQQYLSSGPSLF